MEILISELSLPYIGTMASVMDSTATVADSAPGTSHSGTVELLEADIEGATLEEPLDCKSVPQLRWWLLCHGIEMPVRERKSVLIKR